MTKIKRIAFFAPIKPPDHHIPSGDRLIAQNLLKALDSAGFETDLASRYICYSKRSNPEILVERKEGALTEADAIIARYLSLEIDVRPQIWITYHPYCKAPDWIGPLVSKELDIPYITIEAAKTGQGKNNEWQPWRKEAQEGIRKADAHLCFKPTDRAYLTDLLETDEIIYDFPSFIDTEDHSSDETMPLPKHWDTHTPVLITTGMMRPGKKVRNFELLSETMSSIADQNWNLVIVGGGPEEDNIKSMFSTIDPQRIHFTGQVEHHEVLGWMKAADIFIWPGWKEPIGMVYLEAQLQGLPVIASSSMGVPLVVEDQVTGLLSDEEDIAGMQSNLTKLISDKSLRLNLGKNAKEKVLSNHSIEAAANRLSEILSEF